MMKMASSMEETSSTGRVRDLKQMATIAKMAATESQLVTWMSTVVISLRSLVMTPSPVMRPFGSYCLRMAFSWSIWASASGEAAL